MLEYALEGKVLAVLMIASACMFSCGGPTSPEQNESAESKHADGESHGLKNNVSRKSGEGETSVVRQDNNEDELPIAETNFQVQNREGGNSETMHLDSTKKSEHKRSHLGKCGGVDLRDPNAPDPAPPIPLPKKNARGCVDSHQTYASALEKNQAKMRDKEIKSLGAKWFERDGFFIDEDANKALDTAYAVDGKNFAVVGYGDRRSREARVRIARRGNTLHRVIDQGQVIPVTVQACGANPCPRGSGVRVLQQPVAIRLGINEKLGAPIVLHYRYWWAHPVFEVQRRCPPPPPSAKGR